MSRVVEKDSSVLSISIFNYPRCDIHSFVGHLYYKIFKFPTVPFPLQLTSFQNTSIHNETHIKQRIPIWNSINPMIIGHHISDLIFHNQFLNMHRFLTHLRCRRNAIFRRIFHKAKKNSVINNVRSVSKRRNRCELQPNSLFPPNTLTMATFISKRKKEKKNRRKVLKTATAALYCRLTPRLPGDRQTIPLIFYSK